MHTGDTAPYEQQELALGHFTPSEPDDATLRFVHSSFASVTLPRSQVPAMFYEYHYRSAAIRIEAGALWNGNEFVQQCVPYGPTARLINLYISTYARQHRTPYIGLGKNLTQFVSMIKGRATGGANGTIRSTLTQLSALAACKMSIGVTFVRDRKVIGRTTNIRFADGFEGVISGEHWPHEIKLNDEYYESLREHSLPLDMRAVQNLSKSALALDLLIYFAHRLPRVRAGGEFLRWSSLAEQFGGVGDMKTFKRFLWGQVEAVMSQYPGARIDKVDGGIIMYPSRPLVPRVACVVPEQLTDPAHQRSGKQRVRLGDAIAQRSAQA